MAEKLPAEQWVNAHIEIVVPLLIAVDADLYAKQEAVGEVIEVLDLPPNSVAHGWWEDASIDEREVPDIPAPPSPAFGEENKPR